MQVKTLRTCQPCDTGDGDFVWARALPLWPLLGVGAALGEGLWTQAAAVRALPCELRVRAFAAGCGVVVLGALLRTIVAFFLQDFRSLSRTTISPTSAVGAAAQPTLRTCSAICHQCAPAAATALRHAWFRVPRRARARCLGRCLWRDGARRRRIRVQPLGAEQPDARDERSRTRS
jgi:hypothetical protein